MDASNPVLVRLFELGLNSADLTPRFEIVVGPLVAFDMNDFGQAAEEEPDRSSHVHHVDCHVLAIEQKNARTQSCGARRGRHRKKACRAARQAPESQQLFG